MPMFKLLAKIVHLFSLSPDLDKIINIILKAYTIVLNAKSNVSVKGNV